MIKKNNKMTLRPFIKILMLAFLLVGNRAYSKTLKVNPASNKLATRGQDPLGPPSVTVSNSLVGIESLPLYNFSSGDYTTQGCIPLSPNVSTTVFTVAQQAGATYSWSFGTTSDGTNNSWNTIPAQSGLPPYNVGGNTLVISNFNNQPGVVVLTVTDVNNNATSYTYTIDRFLPDPSTSNSSLITLSNTCVAQGASFTAVISNTGTTQANLNSFVWTVPSGWNLPVINVNGTVTFMVPANASLGINTISAALKSTDNNSACFNNNAKLNYTVNVTPPPIAILGTTTCFNPVGTTNGSFSIAGGANYNWSVTGGRIYAGGNFYSTYTANNIIYISNSGQAGAITATYPASNGCPSFSSTVNTTLGPIAPSITPVSCISNTAGSTGTITVNNYPGSGNYMLQYYNINPSNINFLQEGNSLPVSNNKIALNLGTTPYPAGGNAVYLIQYNDNTCPIGTAGSYSTFSVGLSPQPFTVSGSVPCLSNGAVTALSATPSAGNFNWAISSGGGSMTAAGATATYTSNGAAAVVTATSSVPSTTCVTTSQINISTATIAAPLVTAPSCIGAAGTTIQIPVTNYPGTGGTYTLTYTSGTDLLQSACTFTSTGGTTGNIIATVKANPTPTQVSGTYNLIYTSSCGTSTATVLTIKNLTYPFISATYIGGLSFNGAPPYSGCMPLTSRSNPFVVSVTNPQPGYTYNWQFGTDAFNNANNWNVTPALTGAAPYTLSNSTSLTITNMNNQPGLITLFVVDNLGNTLSYPIQINRANSYTPSAEYLSLITLNKSCIVAGDIVTANISSSDITQAHLNNFAWNVQSGQTIGGTTGWNFVRSADGKTCTITPPVAIAPGTYTVYAGMQANNNGSSCYGNSSLPFTGSIPLTISIKPAAVTVTGSVSCLGSGVNEILTALPNNYGGSANGSYAWAVTSGSGTPTATGSTSTASYTGTGVPSVITATYNAGTGCSTTGQIIIATAVTPAPAVTAPSCIGAVGTTIQIPVTNYPGTGGTYTLTYTSGTDLLQSACTFTSTGGTTGNIIATVKANPTPTQVSGTYNLVYTGSCGTSAATVFTIKNLTYPFISATYIGGLSFNGAPPYSGCMPLTSRSNPFVVSVTNPQPGYTYNWQFGTDASNNPNNWNVTPALTGVAPYTLLNSTSLTITNINNQPGLITLFIVDNFGNTLSYPITINRATPYWSGTITPEFASLISLNTQCITPGTTITANVSSTDITQANDNSFVWSVQAGQTIGGTTGWNFVRSADGKTYTITPPVGIAPNTYTIYAGMPQYTGSSSTCNYGGYVPGPIPFTISVRPASVTATASGPCFSPGSYVQLAATPQNYGGGAGGSYNWVSSIGGTIYLQGSTSTASYLMSAAPTSITATYVTSATCTTTSLPINLTLAPVTTNPVVNESVLNIVRTLETKAPFTDEAAVVSPTRTINDITQTTQYYDGFGRPVESVLKQGSPLGNDLVTANVYDSWGRSTINYLPFVATSAATGDVINDGNVKTDPVQQQIAFYNNLLNGQPGETSIGNNSNNWAYSKINYESSPTERVINAFAPGVNWVGSENTSTPHATAQQFLINTATDNVQIWNIAPAQGSIPVSAGAYPAGQLYKTISIDEQGRQMIEYKDLYGQVILKKQQLTATADNGTGSVHAGWLCTYNVFDDYGNLRFIITPKTVQLIDGSWNINQYNADGLCYRFEYDQLGRIIIKRNPGTATGTQGETWMVYDQRNRLVMQQDANLRSNQKWQYYQYDALDRTIATGLMTDPVNYNNLNFHLSNAASSISYPSVGSYTVEVLSQSFYDNYSWMNSANSSSLTSTLDATTSGTGNSNFASTSFVQSAMTRSMVTGTKIEVLGSTGPQYIYNVSFYDNKARVIQAQSINVTGGKDVMTTSYNFAGKAIQSILSHNKVGTNPQTHIVSTAFTYDAMLRLLTIKKAINSTINGVAVSSASQVTITTKQYDELGRLKVRTLGNNLESLSYDYNVRNWLLGINRNFVSGASSANFFGMELGYDNPVSVLVGATYTTPQYTGNICGTVWKSKGDGVARKYDYAYDNTNRLLKADFTQQNGSGWDVSAGIDYSMQMGNSTDPRTAYDANGNILSMQQKGFKINSSPVIDQLSYSYANNTNQLQQVTDGVNDKLSVLGDFKYDPATKNSIDYTYDANGNITVDNNKRINNVAYNYLNLPQQFAVTNKGTIQYVYNAAGVKLQKVTTENNATVKNITTNIVTTTTYIEGFTYKTVVYSDASLNSSLGYTDVLQFVDHEEGRIRFKPAVGAIAANYVFDYFIKDNLQNVRMVLTDEQQQEIYPVATLEGSITDPNSAAFIENQYYKINPSDIVSSSLATAPPTTLAWYASAQNSTYPNCNGTPPNSIPPNPNPNSNISVNSQYVYKLNGATGDKTGLGITLKVMAGDNVNIFGKSVYHINTGTTIDNNNPIASALLNFITSFAGSSAVISGSHGLASGALFNSTPGITTPLTNDLNDVPIPPTAPKAYINWILFDNQFRAVDNGFDMVDLNPDVVKTHVLPTVNVGKNGYLYVYCSNESNIDVYFDNLQAIQTRGRILEETHYYPYGLTMAGISDAAWNKLANKYHYQSNEMQNGEFCDGSGLEECDFHARHYDQQLGVWHNQDPSKQYFSPYKAMGNNWINGVDPNGKTWLGNIIRAPWYGIELSFGVFSPNKHLTIAGNIVQDLSKVTWQLPQEFLGFTTAMVENGLGLVNSVSYYDGATVLKVSVIPNADPGGTADAFTLGSFINGPSLMATSPDDPTFQHEYGRYLQSQADGPTYLSFTAIPDIFSPGNDGPTAQDGNARAQSYFRKYYRSDFTMDYSNPTEDGIRKPDFGDFLRSMIEPPEFQYGAAKFDDTSDPWTQASQLRYEY